VSLINVLLAPLLIGSSWSTETFISAYLDIAIFASLYFGYKIWYRTKIVSLDESPVARFVEIAENDPDPPEPPKSKWSMVNILWG
jgi:amino acid transporter